MLRKAAEQGSTFSGRHRPARALAGAAFALGNLEPAQNGAQNCARGTRAPTRGT